MRRESGFFESDAERIYWERVGDGPPVVLCHGAGGNHAVWFQQVPELAREHSVIVWDHRGFGRSSARGGHATPERSVRDLSRLMDALGLDRTDLVGQSMGGWTALGLAVAEPDRVRRLVLADTPGGLPCASTRALLAGVGDGDTALAPPGELGLHPAVDPSFRGRDAAHAYLYQMLGSFGEPEIPKIIPDLLGTEVPLETVAALPHRILFVVGSLDRLFRPEDLRELGEALPRAEVVEIPGCGHSPYFEDPQAWNRAVTRFLDSP